MRDSPTWGSHIPVLIRAMEITSGPVLELGLGISSTPLLHALCSHRDRMLVSYEDEKQYVDKFKRYPDKFHKIVLVNNWDDIDVNEYKWSVVLVDHKPEWRRIVEIERLANNAEFLVVHDTELEVNDEYRYDKIYHLFKYRFDYTKAKRHATVLSNVREFI